MFKRTRLIITSIFISWCALSTTAFTKPVPVQDIPTAKNGMVASQEAIASRVGVSILKQGGNAIDAAVAVGFALAVTYPRAGNIGGGGFMVIYHADNKKATAIDYREMAPAASHRDMFLNKDGQVDHKKSRFSALSSGIPGTVAGMIYALEKYGTLPIETVIQPAIDLATDGFTVPAELERSLTRSQRRIGQYKTTASTYYPDGKAPETGSIFKQPDLASVLITIRDKGRDGFYKGEVAEKIATDSANNNGIITMQDLADYRVIERAPVQGTYRGHKIIAMPPPSSGGIHLIQMLNILEHWDIKKSKLNSAETINRQVEAMKRAYADRSQHLGDPSFYNVPVDHLISKDYGEKIYQAIHKTAVTPSELIAPVKLTMKESEQTTHYSVMDKFGNAVANTYTLNASYGNGRVAEGTGILMNNEMDDFSSKPGAPNMFGLIGAEANAIQAGKRPLSSMTPAIVVKDGRPLLATGSVGGSRIITSVLQAISNVIDHDMDIQSATTAPRFHHQWIPDTVVMEQGFEPDTINQLRSMGYKIDLPGEMGNSATPAWKDIGFIQSVMFKEGVFTGCADPRRPHSLAVGY